MPETVGDQVLARLREWGVEQVFAYPGDGINGIARRLRQGRRRAARSSSRGTRRCRRSRRSATPSSPARSACAWRRSGPGAIHLLNGLYDAKLDHVPVVAIVGQTERSAMGGSYQQEVDLQALFKDVASEYLVEVNVPEQLPQRDRPGDPHGADAGARPPPSSSRATCRTETYTPPKHAFKQVPVQPAAAARAARRRRPPARSRRAAEVLNAGQRVAILVGQGARGAADEVAQVADVLGAGRGEGAAGQGRAPRRAAVRHRLDRPARHPARATS